MDLEELTGLLPPFLFTRAFYSSPFAAWLLLFFLLPVLLTQTFNRLRSAPLLLAHPQLGWLWVTRSRSDQTVAESLVVLLCLWLIPASLLALNLLAHARPPLQPPAVDGRRKEQLQPGLPPPRSQLLSDSTRASSVSVWWPSAAAAAAGREEAAWQALALLALLFFLLFLLRNLATTLAAGAPDTLHSLAHVHCLTRLTRHPPSFLLCLCARVHLQEVACLPPRAAVVVVGLRLSGAAALSASPPPAHPCPLSLTASGCCAAAGGPPTRPPPGSRDCPARSFITATISNST